MISLNTHVRAQVLMVVSVGIVVTVGVGLLSWMRNSSTVVGWCLAVFWTLALLAEAFRRTCQGRYPNVRMNVLTHRTMLVLSGLMIFLGGIERIVFVVVFADSRAWWMEQYLVNIVSDSYGSVLFMVVCIGTAMAAVSAGFYHLRNMLHVSRQTAGGAGLDVYAVIVVLILMATIASPVQDWNNGDTFLDAFLDSWYTYGYVDNGPIQHAVYALIGLSNVLLTSRWLRRATRLSAIRTVLVVVTLWVIPFAVNIARFGARELLLFDRGDLLAWTTMLLPLAMYLIATFPVFRRWLVRTWRGES